MFRGMKAVFGSLGENKGFTFREAEKEKRNLKMQHCKYRERVI